MALKSVSASASQVESVVIPLEESRVVDMLCCTKTYENQGQTTGSGRFA